MRHRVQTGDDGRSIRAEVVAVNRLGSVTTQTPAVTVGAEPARTASADGDTATRSEKVTLKRPRG